MRAWSDSMHQGCQMQTRRSLTKYGSCLSLSWRLLTLQTEDSALQVWELCVDIALGLDWVSGGRCICGVIHLSPRACPAYKDACKFCGKIGHWKKFCRKRKGTNRPKDVQQRGDTKPDGKQHRDAGKGSRRRDRRFHDLEPAASYTSEEDSTEPYDCICISSVRNEVFTTLDVICRWKKGIRKIKLKVDTGAAGNTLPLRTYKQMYKTLPPKDVLEPTRNVKVVAYNGQEIPCLGSINLQLRFGEKNFTKAKFYVVDVPSAPIVGLPTCEKIGLVTIHCDDLRPTSDVTTVEGLKQAYPGQFDTLGDFRGVAKLHLKQDCEPFIDPPRKCSIHLKEKLKCELKKMEKQGVIRKVSEHTDWCSSLAYSVKKDGSLRICIDPQKLNQALKRCPHKVPTLEELNPQFAGSTVFSKLDAKAGYWSVHLDPDSQLITTFRTPFGRYCWTRLPFGLGVSQDIFQARMDEILEGLPGVVGITDDVCVHGKDEEEHDRNLKALMDRAKETGLVFSSDKRTIRQPEISFFGNIYSKDGIRPDPAKVHDIENMSVPQDKEDLQRFLGMMTYLATFIPNFSEESQPLRDLLKKNVPFEMSEDHLHCFQKLKTAISAKSCVKYFDPTKPTTLEVDSSTKDLGAAILQDGQPVAFASKALNSAQSNYPNIDREMLAVVFCINRFHTYLYGRPFRVITDHKPLEMISKKPLLRAPPRLQRMLQKNTGIWLHHRVSTRKDDDSGRHSVEAAESKGQRRSRVGSQGWWYWDDDSGSSSLWHRPGQLFTEETASTSRPDSQRSDHECAHGNHHPRMAWQHQWSANWCTSFLVIPWWVGCWGRHHFQGKTSPHPREFASRHSCPTPSVSPRHWEDPTIGQRRGVLAKHQQRHWTYDQDLHPMSGVGKLQQEGAPHTTWHTDGPLEETGHGLVRGGRGAFRADMWLFFKISHSHTPTRYHKWERHRGNQKSCVTVWPTRRDCQW